MSKIQLVAIKAGRYAGKSLAVGDAFEASAKDARILKAVGKAEDAQPKSEQSDAEPGSVQPAAAPEAAKDAPAQPGKKGAPQERAYNRRDMVAKSK